MYHMLSEFIYNAFELILSMYFYDKKRQQAFSILKFVYIIELANSSPPALWI